MNQPIARQAIWEISRGDYLLSTDPARLDLPLILRFLTDESYWARGMTMERLVRALKGSLPIGIYDAEGRQAAFGRLVTDYTVFAYLRDVFVLPEHRGRGLASWLALTIRQHPELRGVTSWLLATQDAQAVYEKAGYRPVPHPERYMSVPKAD